MTAEIQRVLDAHLALCLAAHRVYLAGGMTERGWLLRCESFRLADRLAEVRLARVL